MIYSSKEKDSETGLYYYGARYYAPWLGRWMSCDPSTEDGMNLYVYVKNNPICYNDPDGKKSELPWCLSENKYGGKPVLTFGIENIPQIPKMKYGAWYNPGNAYVTTHNIIASIWNGPTSMWNEAAEGKTLTDTFYDSIESIDHMSGEDLVNMVSSTDFWEDIGAGIVAGFSLKKLASSKARKVLGKGYRKTKKGIKHKNNYNAKELSNPVLDSPKTGSALKKDPIKNKNIILKNGDKITQEFPSVALEHGFNDIIDNYSVGVEPSKIIKKGKNGIVLGEVDLYQIEGSLNNVDGVFEWIVDQKEVTHRRFITNGKVTGFPNQIVK